MRHLALCVFGPDKPGIVEKLSRLVFEHQGSWFGASLAHLAGRFAGIVDVKIPEEHYIAFAAALQDIEDLDIRIAEGGLLPPASADSHDCQLSLVANDRTGIVHELTSTLSRLGVNIEEMTTKCRPAHNYGELFIAKARLRVPKDVTHEQIRELLEACGDDWMLELDEPSVT
ncbi:MAG: ACT domain-containing protein [Pseudomonadota bacterium]|uniref:glycine cleavage system protein R n=1 Tax=Gallaecimonas pentaromativorans TaxID=584787 RepID=UPI00067EEB58|nr:ACT domain-containing protein [Gallaecimonas pentaromativorans]MED5524693.1 ACT domain-containing protein [Pseudomonadota bacterium]